jgi:hypothetical protein
LFVRRGRFPPWKSGAEKRFSNLARGRRFVIDQQRNELCFQNDSWRDLNTYVMEEISKLVDVHYGSHSFQVGGWIYWTDKHIIDTSSCVVAAGAGMACGS